MDDYSKLSKIYEGYLGMSYDQGPNAGYAYDQGPHSYQRGQIPTVQPGTGNRYAMGRVPLNSDEESDPVVNKIETLMKTAYEDEMMYAVHMLGELKAYIEDLQESS